MPRFWPHSCSLSGIQEAHLGKDSRDFFISKDKQSLLPCRVPAISMTRQMSCALLINLSIHLFLWCWEYYSRPSLAN